QLKKIISVISCAVLSALFILLMFFCPPKIATVPETTGEITAIVYPDSGGAEERTFNVGTHLTAVRIKDLGHLGRITKVNYVPDKFVTPNKLDADIQIVDLTESFNFAEKGTLIFVIMNLDPWAENYTEQLKSLAEYRLGDSWHFTLSLPKIFCASNVYLKNNLFSRHGEIENYDFIDYTDSYQIRTEKLSHKTDRTVIDLKFSTSRELMSHTMIAAQIVTIHYQSTGGAFSGITEAPLIGTDSAVTGITENSQNLLIAFAILSAVALAVLVVLSVLERSKEFVSAIIWVFGIFVMLLSRFFLSGATAVPLLWTALWLATSFIILCGALISSGRNFGKIPAKYISVALAAAGALLAFIRPFVPFGVATALATACTVIKAVSVVALILFIGFTAFRKDGNSSILRAVCSALIAVAIAASLFLPQVFPTRYNPMFWMCVATTTVTFISVFIVFM
ncbi:MAG: hypothetical protein K2J54_04260, partial [Clostridia bacterium]|nr:hypothetical protein [Clostridia bacterium]